MQLTGMTLPARRATLPRCLTGQGSVRAIPINLGNSSSICRSAMPPKNLNRGKIRPRSHWEGWEEKREGRPEQQSFPGDDGEKSHVGLRKRDGPLKRVMTINVALATSEMLVLGCDSTASRTERYLDPLTPS